jgi:hypothetical protein
MGSPRWCSVLHTMPCGLGGRMSHVTRDQPINKRRLWSAVWPNHFLVIRSLLLRHAIVAGSTLSWTTCSYQLYCDSALKMVTVCSSVMLAPTYKSTRPYTQKTNMDRTYLHRGENVKFYSSKDSPLLDHDPNPGLTEYEAARILTMTPLWSVSLKVIWNCGVCVCSLIYRERINQFTPKLECLFFGVQEESLERSELRKIFSEFESRWGQFQ